MSTTSERPFIIPSDILRLIGKEDNELRIELAIFFYKKFDLSSGQAAKFAGIPRVAFWHELGKRNIPVNFDENDARHDVEAMRKFNEKFPIAPPK